MTKRYTTQVLERVKREVFKNPLPTEEVLPDEQVVYADYVYIVGDKIYRSPLTGTVLQLKEDYKKRMSSKFLPEVRKCDVGKRDIRR